MCFLIWQDLYWPVEPCAYPVQQRKIQVPCPGHRVTSRRVSYSAPRLSLSRVRPRPCQRRLSAQLHECRLDAILCVYRCIHAQNCVYKYKYAGDPIINGFDVFDNIYDVKKLAAPPQRRSIRKGTKPMHGTSAQMLVAVRRIIKCIFVWCHDFVELMPCGIASVLSPRQGRYRQTHTSSGYRIDCGDWKCAACACDLGPFYRSAVRAAVFCGF